MFEKNLKSLNDYSPYSDFFPLSFQENLLSGKDGYYLLGLDFLGYGPPSVMSCT